MIESSKLVRNRINVEITLPVLLLQIITQSNGWISALNTNVQVKLYDIVVDYYAVGLFLTTYFSEETNPNPVSETTDCDMVKAVAPSGFYSASYYNLGFQSTYWPNQISLYDQIRPNAMVNGFYTSCTALEGLLASTLDCLYNATCLWLLANYFPGMNQVGTSSYHHSSRPFFILPEQLEQKQSSRTIN